MDRHGFLRRPKSFRKVSLSRPRPSHLLIAVMMLFSSAPASAGQWVYGTVEIVEDYGGYAGGTLGVLVTLTSRTWGAGDGGPAGATACAERFSLVTGQQGVDENSKNRMFSILLTAAATRERIGMFVDTNTGPYCKVIIASYGR